jgi:hypothetical protein
MNTLYHFFNYHWYAVDGKLFELRYTLGHWHEYLYGYEPDGTEWPYRLARFLGLSGY